MSKEVVTIKTYLYSTPEGKYTCSLNVETKEYCDFLRTKRFGTLDTCLFANYDTHGNSVNLQRSGKDKLGFLIPGSFCPLLPENRNN